MINMEFTKTLFGHVKHIRNDINTFGIETYCKQESTYVTLTKKLPICKKCLNVMQEELENMSFGC